MASVVAAGRADLTDAQWALLRPLLPVGRRPGRPLGPEDRDVLADLLGRVVLANEVPEVFLASEESTGKKK